MSNPSMSNEQYVQNHGVRCPYCNSRDIEQGKLDQCPPVKVYIPVVCNSCNKEWNDEYTLTGFEIIQE